MNYNIGIAIVVFVSLILAGTIWNRYYMSYLARIRNGDAGTNTRRTQGKSVLSVLHSGSGKGYTVATGEVLLNNTDYDISEALEYVRPTKHIHNLLERLYSEQRGI